MNVPRYTAAASPIPIANITQMTAAPSTSDSVTGAAATICGITGVPRLTNDVRSRVMKSFFIINPYWIGQRAVEPELVLHGGERRRGGVAAGDARRRVDARGREEDHVRQQADREQHEDHRDRDGGRRRRTSAAHDRSLARGSRASRSPSPNTFRVSTTSTIAMPGAIDDPRPRVQHVLAVADDRAPARLRAAARRSPRNDSAASVSIVVAIISGKNTITVVITFGRISLIISRQSEAPCAIAASTNSFWRTESTWPRIGRATYGM